MKKSVGSFDNWNVTLIPFFLSLSLTKMFNSISRNSYGEFLPFDIKLSLYITPFFAIQFIVPHFMFNRKRSKK